MENEVRVFRCIGLEEHGINNWKDAFTIGKVYEMVHDCGTIIKLKGNYFGSYETTRWVDSDQFEEITINEI